MSNKSADIRELSSDEISGVNGGLVPIGPLWYGDVIARVIWELYKASYEYGKQQAERQNQREREAEKNRKEEQFYRQGQ